VKPRGKSPSGRIHVRADDQVTIGQSICRVLHLDNVKSHVQAKVRWPDGHTSWEDLNTMVLFSKDPVLS
jgi:hypothetical protein